MSDLFSLLGIASKALDAQQYGLDVTGQNIANVNTQGYTRRSVVFEEVPPSDSLSAGGGVDVQAVVAARTPLIDARLYQEQPAAARDGAVADQLSVVETALGAPGASLDASLAAFYNAFGALAADPTSAVARQQVVAQGQLLSGSFNDLASRFDSAARDADTALRQTLDQVNALAQQIAALNGAIASAPAGAVDALKDQQAAALQSLSSLIDIGVMNRQDGGVDVTIGNGRALVVGANPYSLTASSNPPQGFATIIAAGAAVPTDVTGEITGGRIGGLLQVRDVLVPSYAARLDQLAYAVATDVNALHTSGFDLNGAPGGNFFAPPSAVAGAARSLAVDAAVSADPSLVAAAGSPAAGNNGVARAIAALQDAPMGGSTKTPVGAWGDLVYRVGLDARAAADGRSGHEQVSQQLETLRSRISGVSLDEEAAMLMKFQRAYEANARFFSTASQTLDMLLQMVNS
jgi:flagellar hook-associated protein 1 FlgK